jgi:hypothetical protein
MVSDVNGTVIAIQGNSVSSETLGASEDGYVLTWDNTDGYLVARPVVSGYTGLRQAYFTSSGSWTCPTGVTNIIVIGCGGGGGGLAGGGYGNGGGGGTIQNTTCIAVTPGNNYTITIGAGGSGGVWSGTTSGSDGGTTSFGTLFYTKGAGGAQGSGGNLNGACVAGTNSLISSVDSGFLQVGPAVGGTSINNNNGVSGSPNYIGSYSGGSAGGAGGEVGGSGGGAGPQGNGGNGGIGNSSGNATNGTSAAANTGAGGGGGGSAYYLYDAGNGGSGGSGYLYILY